MSLNIELFFLDELGSNQWEAQSQTRFQPMFPPEHLRLGTSSESQSNHHMSPNLLANNAVLWSGDSRQGMSLALPPMMYPSAVSSDGLMVAEQQYSNSLLNLLHNDRPDMSTVMGPSSKQELMSGYTKYPGFGDQMPCDINLNSGKCPYFLPSCFNHTHVTIHAVAYRSKDFKNVFERSLLHLPKLHLFDHKTVKTTILSYMF